MMLAVYLVSDNSRTVGEVQRPRFLHHGYTYGVLPVSFQKWNRKTGGLFSEKKKTFFGIIRQVVTEGSFF
jgi:hypothetical protein